MYKTAEELRSELPSEQGPIPLSQGDILDACPLVFWPDQIREVAEAAKPRSVSARVMILTQACDLANDKTVRAIVAVVHDAANLVQTGRVKEKFIRDNVRRGQVYGWYFLPAPCIMPRIPRVVGRSPGPSHGAAIFVGRSSGSRQVRLPSDHSLPRTSRTAFLGHLITNRPPRTLRDRRIARIVHHR